MTTPVLTTREQRRAQRESIEWAPVREYLQHPRIVFALEGLPGEAAELHALAPELLPWIASALRDPKYPAPDPDDGFEVRNQLEARCRELEKARECLTDGRGVVERMLSKIRDRTPEFFAQGFGPQVLGEADGREAWPLLGRARGLRDLRAEIAAIEAVIDRLTPASARAPLTGVRTGSGAIEVPSSLPQRHAVSTTREDG